MAVTLTQLSAFVAVVKNGSVTAAAEELVVTQPSVSSAVAALEREVGVKLIERAGRTVRATAAGELYARYALHVLGLVREGSQMAQAQELEGTTPLRIMAVPTAADHLLPPLIQGFREQRPGAELSVVVGNRDAALAALLRHDADLVITGWAPESDEYRAVQFAETEHVLVTRPEDTLARRQWVAVEELGGRPWLVREPGSGIRALTESYLAAHQIRPELISIGSNAAIVNAVKVGLGIALQNRLTVQTALDLGVVAAITPRSGLPRRAWLVVTSRVGPRREPVDAFVEFLRSDAARIFITRAREAELARVRRELASHWRDVQDARRSS
jgi:LysR family transcriptional regulator, low CO2-responsive transcriptional regulator